MEKQETEKKIAQLQALEQNLQNFLLQRQSFQSQIVEVDNALEEVGKTKGAVYRIIGSVMVVSDKEDVKGDLDSKREVLDIKVRNLEKQEEKIKEKASKLQADVLDAIKGGGDEGDK